MLSEAKHLALSRETPDASEYLSMTFSACKQSRTEAPMQGAALSVLLRRGQVRGDRGAIGLYGRNQAGDQGNQHDDA